MIVNICLLVYILTMSFAIGYKSMNIQRLIKKSVNLSVNNRYLTNQAEEQLILFDGMCNFCNKGVDFLKSIDINNKYKYTALQSEKGQKYLMQIGKERNDLSSIILLNLSKSNSKETIKSFYSKSDVTLQILNGLGYPYNLIGYMGSVIPKPFRDIMYDGIANNRYSIMGKREECRCGEF